MKIAIDVRTISKPRSGVGHYVTNLIRELQAIDGDNSYLLISNDGAYETEFSPRANFENYKTWISNENHLVGDLWESLWLPGMLRKRGVDVFHGPAFMIPLRLPAMRAVVTIHDIVAFIKPETVPLKYAMYMRFLISLVARKADRIITPSQSTKKDLVNILSIPEERINVVYEAVSGKFRPAGDAGVRADVKRRFGIRDRYMLFVGNLEPRKNLVRLLRAFEAARERLGGAYQLVICGKKGWLYKDILKTFREVDKGDVILTSYVSDPDLVGLYQGADMFVFPTLYEGFGLPVLEAMACGAPVINSNVSSLPEISEDASILIDPLDVESISEAMVRLAFSESLRDELREKGLRRAARFSWTETARKTLDVYRSVA
ncbi:MAG: glycosyltransferase family 4 protein [Candidatus Nitrospinota bacterium M3_3B_026]